MLSLTLALLPALSYAWPPTFGLELNLRSKKLQNIWAARMRESNTQTPTETGEGAETRKFAEALFRKCQPLCQRTEHVGKFGLTEWRFQFESGFQFNLSTDPATVEVQVGPFVLEDWKRYRADIQTYLYDFAKKEGLSHERDESSKDNSAHLNMGFASSFDSGRQFAHFLADYWQYWELGDGLLGGDPDNAPPLSLLNSGQKTAAKKILENFNRGGRPITAHDLAVQISRQVYTYTPTFSDGPEHYQQVGLKYVVGRRTLKGDGLGDVPYELRANREPESAEVAVLQLELQQMRLEYHRRNADQPIFLDVETVDQTKGMTTPRSRLTAFALYLGDMGALDQLDRFRPILSREVSGRSILDFMGASFSWRNPNMVDDLVSMSLRARHSPYLRERLVQLFQDPESFNAPGAKTIIEKLIPKISEYEDDPLTQALRAMISSPGWVGQALATEMDTKISVQVHQKRQAQGFSRRAEELWSSCRTFFQSGWAP
ncbi:MAG: hypothetical protein JNL01_12370 [Bdellovibrionales bacterium]|nr:hypothetical protein [Bdellovibrionales bacterium]